MLQIKGILVKTLNTFCILLFQQSSNYIMLTYLSYFTIKGSHRMIKMQLIEHEFYYNFIIPLFWRKKLANIFIWPQLLTCKRNKSIHSRLVLTFYLFGIKILLLFYPDKKWDHFFYLFFLFVLAVFYLFIRNFGMGTFQMERLIFILL